MSRSNRNCCTAAKLSNRDPARAAAASRTSSTSVTLRHTSTSTPACRSTRAATSPQTNVAAWPRCVVSYGVIPQTYTRARPTTGHRPPLEPQHRQRSGRVPRRAARRNCRIRRLPGIATSRMPAIAASSSATPDGQHALEGEERDLHRVDVLQDEHQQEQQDERGEDQADPQPARAWSSARPRWWWPAERTDRTAARPARCSGRGSPGSACPGSVTGSAVGSSGPALPWAGTPPRWPRPASSLMSPCPLSLLSSGRPHRVGFPRTGGAWARAEPRPSRSRGRSGQNRIHRTAQ